MSANSHPLLVQVPTVISLIPNLTCAESMIIAAQKAENKGLIFIQFKHDHPPRFAGPNGTSKTIVMVDSLKISVPKALIHVTMSQIGINGFVKLTPNYFTVLESVLTKKA